VYVPYFKIQQPCRRHLRHDIKQHAKRSNPFSLRDGSRDGGGRAMQEQLPRMRGYIKQRVIYSDPLTPTLSHREREFMGQ